MLADGSMSRATPAGPNIDPFRGTGREEDGPKAVHHSLTEVPGVGVSLVGPDCDATRLYAARFLRPVCERLTLHCGIRCPWRIVPSFLSHLPAVCVRPSACTRSGPPEGGPFALGNESRDEGVQVLGCRNRSDPTVATCRASIERLPVTRQRKGRPAAPLPRRPERLTTQRPCVVGRVRRLRHLLGRQESSQLLLVVSSLVLSDAVGHRCLGDPFEDRLAARRLVVTFRGPGFPGGRRCVLSAAHLIGA